MKWEIAPDEPSSLLVTFTLIRMHKNIINTELATISFYNEGWTHSHQKLAVLEIMAAGRLDEKLIIRLLGTSTSVTQCLNDGASLFLKKSATSPQLGINLPTSKLSTFSLNNL